MDAAQTLIEVKVKWYDMARYSQFVLFKFYLKNNDNKLTSSCIYVSTAEKNDKGTQIRIQTYIQ